MEGLLIALAQAEPTPSPPSSPSPNALTIPTCANNEQQPILEVNMVNVRTPTPSIHQDHPTPTTTLGSTPHFQPNHSTENANSTQQTPTSTPSTLWNQVSTATACGDPNSAMQGTNRSPLDRFTNAIMPDIQNAYPTAVFNGINLDCLDEWAQYKGFKLLAILFKNDARIIDKYDGICTRIFAAIMDITQLWEIGVTAPVPNNTLDKPKIVPTMFLIYNLTSTNNELLLA